MNQRSAHPGWREPINRCENGRIVGNCIRTTDIFCQFPPWWRHSESLGSRRLGRTFLMHLLQKKELDHSEKKTPLKPWTFPTSAFRRIKRRRGWGKIISQYAARHYPLLAPISLTIIHGIICCFSLRRPNGAMARMADGALASSALIWPSIAVR